MFGLWRFRARVLALLRDHFAITPAGTGPQARGFAAATRLIRDLRGNEVDAAIAFALTGPGIAANTAMRARCTALLPMGTLGHDLLRDALTRCDRATLTEPASGFRGDVMRAVKDIVRDAGAAPEVNAHLFVPPGRRADELLAEAMARNYAAVEAAILLLDRGYAYTAAGARALAAVAEGTRGDDHRLLAGLTAACAARLVSDHDSVLRRAAAVALKVRSRVAVQNGVLDAACLPAPGH